MNLIKFCKDKSFVVISNKVKEEINKLGKLSIYVARKPNQKEMIDLMKEKFTLGKKLVDQKKDAPKKVNLLI